MSIGVGEYPAPKKSWLSAMRWLGYLPSVKLLQKSLEIIAIDGPASESTFP